MNETIPEADQDDQFSEYLAAFDEAMAGTGIGPTTPAKVPDHLKDRLQKAQACLLLLNQARPPSIPVAPSTPATDPATLGRFRIIRELGRGGCGVVFLAHDPGLKREVALKVPLPEILATPQSRQRFLREAQAAAQINHPNVIAVHESGEVGPIAYIAYAYCPGPTLARWLAGHKAPVLPGAAAGLVLVLARAVQHCHDRGVLHRDLKPGNILLAGDATPGDPARALAAVRPMIADFGLARIEAVRGDRTRTGVVMGTAAYMAPEQARGQIDRIGPRTDVYALGAILFELLGGRPPFQAGSDLDTMRLVLQEEPPGFASLGRSVHRDLETICRKCLEKDSTGRYGSAAELGHDLERFVNGEPIRARPVGAIERNWRRCRRRPALTALVVLSLTVAFIVPPGWFWYSINLQSSEARNQAAEESARQDRLARHAAEQNASTQRYFGLLHRLKQRNGQKPLGWTWAGLGDLKELAKIDTPARDPVELRSEAATLFAGVDLRETGVLTNDFSAYCLAFSPDGKSLAAGQDLATAFLWAPIRVYDWPSGKLRFELTYPCKMAKLPTGPAPDGAICLAYSADGQFLAVGTRSGQVHRWDLAHDPPKRVSWQAASRRLNEICFHPRDNSLFTASHRDRFIKRWDVNTAKELARFEAPADSVHGISPRPDGAVIAAIVDDKIAYFDADTLRELNKTRPIDERLGLFSLCYSPDGRFLAVQAEKGMLVLIYTEGGEVRRFTDAAGESAHRGGINRLEFSKDGSLLFSASENELDRTVKVWEVASGRLLAESVLGESGPLAFAVHPRGQALAAAASRRIAHYELAGSDVETFRAHHPYKLQSVAFAPDGGWMACAGDPQLASRVPLHHFSIWKTAPDRSLATRAVMNDHDQPTWQPLALAFHPTDPVLGVTGWGNWIWLGDSASEIAPLTPARIPSLLAFDRSGQKIWAILEQHTVQSWHWPERKIASTWRYKPLPFNGRDQLYCLAAGNRWIMVGGRDGQTHLLNASDGKLSASWPGPGAPIRSIAISASETWAAIASQDGQVRIVNLPDGKLLASWRDDSASLTGIAIAPSDAFLATASTQNRVHVYAVADRQPRHFATLSFPAGPVRSLCFLPKANQLALIAGPETAVRVWDLDQFQDRLTNLHLP